MLSFFARAGGQADRFVRRFMPDPFVLVLLLTLVALGCGLLTMDTVGGVDAPTAGTKVRTVVRAWAGGFGNAEILKFGLQIILIVVTGEAIAAAPLAQRGLRWLTTIPSTSTEALVLVTFFAIVTGWLHWGFGLVASALLAREVGRSFAARNIPLHYPLLGTGAYTSMLLWHAGITASAPLLMNTPKNFVSDVLGLEGKTAQVPLRETIFSPYNLVVCAILALTVPFLVAMLDPSRAGKGAGVAGADQFELPTPASEQTEEERPKTVVGWLDRTPALSITIGITGLLYSAMYLINQGFDLNHNFVNFTFLSIGLLLHRSPVAYARALSQSVRGVGGIVLQFPFYGGILEVMKATGLSEKIAHVFIAAATPKTLAFFTFVASLITKSFVPSGAGEWAVEGPPMLKAAQALGVSFGKVTMGVAYGNMLGNMYQPFWSLPLLGLMGLKARDIMGYGLILLVVTFPILGLALLWS